MALHGSDRQRTIRAFAEALGLEAEGVIEAGAVIFPRDHGREFDQLSFVELGAQALKELVGNFDGRVRHGISVGEHALFDVGKHGAALVLGQSFDFLGGDAVLSADRRPNVNSKRTADERGHAQGGKFLERFVEFVAGEE